MATPQRHAVGPGQTAGHRPCRAMSVAVRRSRAAAPIACSARVARVQSARPVAAECDPLSATPSIGELVAPSRAAVRTVTGATGPVSNRPVRGQAATERTSLVDATTGGHQLLWPVFRIRAQVEAGATAVRHRVASVTGWPPLLGQVDRATVRADRASRREQLASLRDDGRAYRSA